MKYISILLIVILTYCSKEKATDCNYITDYYQNIYKADMAYEIKNYKKAFELYNEAFYSCEPVITSTYNELSNFAETCAILGENDLAIEFIKKRIKRGFEIKWLMENPNYDNIFASKKGQELISNYENLRKNALSELNLALREEIKKMRVEDQKYRAKNYQGKEQDAIDDYNTKRLIEIFEEFGFPNESVIGGYSVDRTPVTVTAMLLHTSDSIRMHYFVPKLKEFVKNGTCPPDILGVVIDQYHLYNDEPQIYGTYTNESGGYANMIADLEKVDNNRLSIGLPPLRLKEKKDSIFNTKYNK